MTIIDSISQYEITKYGIERINISFEGTTKEDILKLDKLLSKGIFEKEDISSITDTYINGAFMYLYGKDTKKHITSFAFAQFKISKKYTENKTNRLKSSISIHIHEKEGCKFIFELYKDIISKYSISEEAKREDSKIRQLLNEDITVEHLLLEAPKKKS